RRRGPGFLARERAQGVAQILDKRVDGKRAFQPSVAPTGDGDALVAVPRKIAESLGGGATCLVGTHAERAITPDQHLEMKAKLIVDVGGNARAPEVEVAPPGRRFVRARREIVARALHHARPVNAGIVTNSFDTAPV